MKMNIKKGDNVLVITGKDKGKTGKVMEVSPVTTKLLLRISMLLQNIKSQETLKTKAES